MKEKTLHPGDHVSLKTKDKTWRGHILESHDAEIVLIKLETGYNIGVREKDILDVTIIEKAKKVSSEKNPQEKNPALKNVAMIMTGGTISSRLDPKTGGVIYTDEEEILNIAPEIKEVCNIVTIEKPLMKFSEDMGYRDWKKIAETAEKLLNDETIDGIIITHGTDFLHYTASALSFFLQNLNKPVALTAAQKSIDRGSTDAALNLLCAAKFAVSDLAHVAIVTHKDENDLACVALEATKTRKMHTSARAAFKPINSIPLAEITKTTMHILKEFNARDPTKKVRLDTAYEKKIATIKIKPDQDPKILEYLVQQSYKGIVLEVAGIGGIPGPDAEYNWFPKIKEAVKQGVIICATAQTIYGRLNPNVYSGGRLLQKTGIIFLEDMLTETALVKLGWVLGHKDWNPQEKMLENLRGEFSEKIK